MTKEQSLLDEARILANSAQTWADLSNALYAPHSGLVAKAFGTRQEREQFVRSNEHAQIRELIRAAQLRTGLVAGATPTTTLDAGDARSPISED